MSQYHMIITKKRRVRKESEKAKNGSKKAKKADAPEDRYIAFAPMPRGWMWKNIPKGGPSRHATDW